MMRVAYICADPGVPIFGRKGCSVHVGEMLRALAAHGVRVNLFAARFDGKPPAEYDAVLVHPLPAASRGDLVRRERAALAANDRLREALELEGPFELVYERYSLWSFAGMEYARAAGIPGALEVNAPLIEEQSQHRGLADLHGARRVAQRAFGAAATLLAVSQEVAAYLQRYPEARGRVHVSSNGVNPDRFPADLRPSRPAPDGTFTVGFVGTLKPWHGLPILVEAFATLHRNDPRVRLLIVGDGPQRAVLEASLAAQPRELAAAVELTGAVPPEEIPALLASMDVAVAPYPQLDNFYFSPLKVYEYMAAGLPVAASRIGEIARLIRDGVDGLLCPPGDSSALAAALNRLRRDPALRRRMGHAGRKAVLANHTWDAAVRRLFGLVGAETSLQPCAEGDG